MPDHKADLWNDEGALSIRNGSEPAGCRNTPNEEGFGKASKASVRAKLMMKTRSMPPDLVQANEQAILVLRHVSSPDLLL